MKRRAPGVGCTIKGRKICRRNAYATVGGKRMCAKHAADALFAAETRAACDGRCWAEGYGGIACNGGLQCMHILRRSYLAVRWDKANAMPGCAAHHLYFTHHPLEWEEFCRRSGVDWDDLRHRALNDPPMDPEQVIAEIEAA